MMLGLRVDVDTLFGLSRGVPRLLALLEDLDLKATFFVPMGPDRMGRSVKRIVKERGLGVSLAPYLRIYPWQTFLAGTVVDTPGFSNAGARMMLRIRGSGHDVGIHSYDHFNWQNGVTQFSRADLAADFTKCTLSYARVFGELPACCAAPGWRATRFSLSIQEGFGFDYASDTRGTGPFYPAFENRSLRTLQIPVTLPTVDELILQGKDSLDLPGSGAHVYCAHAEVEGLSRLEWFRSLLVCALEKGFSVVSLSTLADLFSDAPRCGVAEGRVRGRSSTVALQVTP
ncbi:MAG: polysaccharide deacetylase family protein [bacterium]